MSNLSFPDNQAGAEACIAGDPTVTNAARSAVAAGTHVWAADPEIAGVWGLIRKGTNTADIVVYCNEADFEVSEEFFPAE